MFTRKMTAILTLHKKFVEFSISVVIATVKDAVTKESRQDALDNNWFKDAS